MAKVIFTALVADMRNGCNEYVFSKNRYGPFARSRSGNAYVGTSRRDAVGVVMSDVSVHWSALTEAQRQSWLIAAPRFPVQDVFGIRRQPSGRNLYLKLNCRLDYYGLATIDTAPLPVAVPGFPAFAFTIGFPSEILLNGTPPFFIPAGFTAVVYATDCYSPGIYNFKNRLRFIETIPAGALLALWNIFTNWSAIYGALASGTKLSVKIFYINNNTGQIGVAYTRTQEIT